VSITGALAWTWDPASADPRALEGSGASGRLAACWYSGGSFLVDVNLTDGAPHQIALYSVDWDSRGRSQRIDVIDAATGAVLDTRAMGGYENGLYLVWTISGHVTFRIVNTGPENAVLSGIFFGSATGAPAGGGTAAAFAGSDSATSGNWKGVYGVDGLGLAAASATYPSYAQVSVADAQTWTWAWSSGDPRALQRPDATDRLAATWYSATGFAFDVNLTDGASHRVALYGVDWDSLGRTQRVEVVDASTGSVLDTRSMSAFQNGQYMSWIVTGHVKIKVINTGPANAVVSGILFGGASLTTPSSDSPRATFVKADEVTSGAWSGAYGRVGYAVAGGPAVIPGWARVASSGESPWMWASSTTDGRALQGPGAADGIAACWYSNGAFTMDLDITDGASHYVSLYALDWDYRGRAERVDVIDTKTGAVLDTRTLSAFQNGRYLVWNVSGHVAFRITGTAGPNGVVSGWFFD
jgi:hypothetical protein